MMPMKNESDPQPQLQQINLRFQGKLEEKEHLFVVHIKITTNYRI